MDGEALPGKGEPLEARFLSGGTQNVIYEMRRGDARCVLRMPPPGAPPGPRQGHPARVADHRGARRHRRAAHRGRRRVRGRRPCSAAPFYLMGFVDGWSPMDTRRTWPEPFDSDLDAAPGLAYQLVEGIALLSKVDWQAKGLEDLGRPDGFHERQVDRWTGFLERIKGRELPGLDVATGWLRAHRPLDYIPGLMHGDYQFANVMYQHGAPAQLAAIVDWEMGTVGDPKLDLGWMVQSWPGGHDGAGSVQRDELRRHARHAVARRRWSRTTPKCRAARSTTSTTTWCWPSGSSRSCWSRASSVRATTRSCWRSGPSSRDLMRSAADLAESTRLPVSMSAPRSARRTGRRMSSASRSMPSPTVAPGQVRVRVGAAAVNFPDVLLVANEYQISVPPPFVPGSEFAGVIVETGDGADGFAVGDRVTGTGTVRRLRRGGRGARRRADADPRRRRRAAPPRRSASPTGRPITRCGRWRACSRATR